MNSVSLSYSSSASVLTGPLISGLNLYTVGCLSAESDLLEADFKFSSINVCYKTLFANFT